VVAVVAVIMTALFVATSAACSSGGDSASDSSTTTGGQNRTDVLAGLAERVIVPAYADLADATAAQTQAVEALCASPGPAQLDAARQAWLRVNQAWGATSAFRFGPVSDRRLDASIDFPIKEAKVAALAGGSDPIDASSLGDEGADVRGSAAIEWLLFADEPMTDHRCAYASAAAELVEQAAARAHDAWTQPTDGQAPFADQLSMAADGGMYATEQDALADVANGAIFALKGAAEMILEKASGALTSEADPAGVDAGRAHQAREDALAAVASADAVYGGAGGPGLGAIVSEISPDTDQRMRDKLAEARQAVEAIPPPIATAVDIAPIRSAFYVVRQAQVLMGTEVASTLGITLAFADTDGDS
jgi:predicted lipoprotein